jgi:putative ABC transport system permease protein
VLSRIGAIGSAIIGVLGLLLAAVGIYGMVSFAVSQRTHEVGVRMALGARGGDVLCLVLREAMRPVVIGVVVGLAAAAGVSQILVAFLFGLSTLDPVTFVSVAVLLMAVALLAGYVPARRATKVDPMVALRYE